VAPSLIDCERASTGLASDGCTGRQPRSAPIRHEPERLSRSDSSKKKVLQRVWHLFFEIFRLNSLDGHPRSRGHALLLSFFYLP
jgi:hypothetical protein